jgi:hypothetical protein
MSLKRFVVIEGVSIHISTSLSPYLGDVGSHNHPFLGPSVPAGGLMGLAHSWHSSQRVFASDLHGLVHALPISGWAMALIPFVTFHPNDTQYCSSFGSPKPDFPGGHPFWYYSRKSTLNCEVLMGSLPSRL